MRCLLGLCVAVSVLASSAFAQRGSRTADTSNMGNLTIRVLYPDERPAQTQLLVQLMQSGSSSAIATTFTNEVGQAGFGSLPIGMYHVVVSGDSIETSDSGAFEVDARKSAQTQFVYVQRKAVASSQNGGGSSTVQASALAVPKKALQEFNKGVDATSAKDWPKALDHLVKATEIYPQYAAAYTNLGVVYGQLNDPVHQREALEKAVGLDDHFAPALVNLARLDYRDKRFAETQQLLEKATAVDPVNAVTLTLLAQADLVNQDYDNAIANAKKVHNLPHEHLAVIHYIAAKALELKHRAKDAVAELEMLLSEEPEGPRAVEARNEVSAIQGRMGPR